jgi:2-octaprenyl-6-methoxyphenol hydroxylase
MNAMTRTTALPTSIAIVGAGPVGVSLALWMALMLPHTRITLIDARPIDSDLNRDPRTLALSWGSVQMLQRLNAWAPDAAEPIWDVRVSQQSTAQFLGACLPKPEVHITAKQQKQPMLGAVMHYGTLLQALQQQWLLQARAADRLHSQFGAQVVGITPRPLGIELQTQIQSASQAVAHEHTALYDLVLVAEGNLQKQAVAHAPKSQHRFSSHTYAQTAWLGSVDMANAPRGVAFERFTLNGPAALLPLGDQQNALVWCVPSKAGPVQALNDAARIAVLNTIFPEQAGKIIGISALKPLPLVMRVPCRAQADPRIWTLGNAAQTLHPVAGQGLNLGLRDALVCAEALRWASVHAPSHQHPDWYRAAKHFERSRAPDRWATLLATDALARGFSRDWPGLLTARELGLVAVQTWRPLKTVLANHMMFGWR